MSLTYDLTLAGLAVGSAAALTGIGLIVTYRATGVLNLAHGAVAMVAAYALRQFTVEWGWPLPLAAAVTLCVLAPAFGLLLDLAVFRPLAGETVPALVASLGVFVLLVGVATLLWGTGARSDAPRILPEDPWIQLAATLALALAVTAVTRWTRFGRELRAVVDDRALARLTGIHADRVSAAGWAFGTFTAGLTGVLLAPALRLDPYGLPLLVMEVMAVAVVARMRGLPVAIGAALAVAVAQSQLTRFHPENWAQPLLQSFGANLFAVALLGAALALPAPPTPGASAASAASRPAPPPLAARRGGAGPLPLVAAILFLLPLGFAGSDLRTSVQVPALAVILLSLVVVTGRGGQISLGQAAYAGLGALFTAHLSPQLPNLLALAAAVALVAPLGLLTGWPAIRRRGLALALTTLAFSLTVSRFVLDQPYATTGLAPDRPAWFHGDRAYYALELALLALAAATVTLLRRGRHGRALAALRDDERAASAAGVAVPALKLTTFVTGAALAALGGGMLTMGVRAFDAGAFDPVRGLLWFAAIVVLGSDSVIGALAAAALLVGLDAGAQGGWAAAVIGVLAVLTGRHPGVVPALTEAARRLTYGSPVPRRPIVHARNRPGAAPSHNTRTPRTGPDAEADPAAGTGTGAGTAPTPAQATATGTAPGAPPAISTGTSPDADPNPVTTTGAGTSTSTDPAAGAGAATDTGTGADPNPAPTTGTGMDPTPGPTQTTSTGTGPATGTPTATGTTPGPTTPTATGPDADPNPVTATATGTGTDPNPDPATAPGTDTGTRPPTPAPFLLCARSLSAAYGGHLALRDAGLTVPPYRVTALVGPNGAGKSTLFHCLAGTLRPRSGTVLLGARDITTLPPHARTRLGVARTFQQLAVFPSLTVAGNVRVGAEYTGVSAPAARDATDRALRLLRLGPLRDTPAAGLPTAVLRRVELARALATNPHTLLLDEPTAGLDTAETADLVRLLRALAADGMALLVIEHDRALVAELADTVHTLEPPG
ncbi:ABC transporter permease subunit [Streptomyces sp. NPDC054796]